MQRVDRETHPLAPRKSSRDGRGDSSGSGEQENVKAVETLSNIERRLDGIVAAGNNSRDD